MSYQEYAPHPLLANYIKCLWILERDFQPLNGSMDVLPDSYIEVIFNFGSACEVDDGQAVWQLPARYVVTLFDKPFRLLSIGTVKTIGVRFFAWGFSQLMGLHLDPAQIIHPLDENCHPLMPDIAQVDDADASDIIQQHFIKQALKVTFNETAVQSTAQLLFDQHGGTKVEDLATYSHLSRRQLERKFRNAVGMSPKTLALRMRFEQVRDQLCREPEIDLTVLALNYGYADQSHMSREFKQFSNRTLSQFLTEIHSVNESLRYGVAFPFNT